MRALRGPASLPGHTGAVADRNVLGGELEPCGIDPLTGFYRDGCCRTGPEDREHPVDVPPDPGPFGG